MERRTNIADDYFRRGNIENLLLMAVLGDASVRTQARAELHRRRIITPRDDFEDSFMTNLSVV